MKEFRIGTCSWTDRSLLSSGWYPDSARDAQSRLRHYSGFFDTVEVDSTFYAIPDESSFYHWASRTSPGFLFNVKAFGLFTFHTLPVSSLPAQIRPKNASQGSKIRIGDITRDQRVGLWNAFVSRVLVLHRMERLGYILFQFPPWVTFSEKNLRWFRRIGDLAAPMRVALEVRHRSWVENENRERLLEVLREENMALAAVDEPKLDWTVPFDWSITATWGTVLRFHGRNAPAWSKRNASVAERFNYLYDTGELEAFREASERLPDDTGRVFLMFNNCFRDNAVRNALQMRKIMGFGAIVPPGQESLGLGEVAPDENE
ncbi:MAG TPA: DUF72 domain-containing protein [Synergistales bacterium]|jgi:uncharacterized protein YecE (DUF72 family)|nr:DUF72 domain-containing protein [Synergistales bacterium]HRV70473.1 DUF72 domain-containing protein [Thermovirgaceae bacterium]